MLVHVQLLCTQRGKELGFSWRVENSSKQSKAHSSLMTSQRNISIAPTDTVWPLFQRGDCSRYKCVQLLGPRLNLSGYIQPKAVGCGIFVRFRTSMNADRK